MNVPSIFGYAFVNAMLSRFNPGLAQRTEAFVKVHGFDALLTAMFQSSEAQKHIQRAFAEALNEAARNGHHLSATRETILSKVSLGVRSGPVMPDG